MPRRTAPTRRVMLEKTNEPMKKAAMETSDFSQPHGLLSGWPEAPRPRKMVFPSGDWCLLAMVGVLGVLGGLND